MQHAGEITVISDPPGPEHQEVYVHDIEFGMLHYNRATRFSRESSPHLFIHFFPDAVPCMVGAQPCGITGVH
eukprot:15450569-Alexandrium_andersonii.AAC.1